MSCTNPQCAIVPYRGGSPVFLRTSYEPKGDFYHPNLGKCRVVYLPCGNCIACRRERRQDLTVLQCLEGSLYDDNWFLTLTYDDWSTIKLTGLDPYSLDKSHLASFNESMRKYCSYHGVSYRFFACGEYGERFERPHYHLSLFGLSPKILGISDDLETQTQRRISLNDRARLLSFRNAQTDANGNPFWQSPVISDRWRYGHHKIYRANRETFQYVAGYVVKKFSGDLAKAFKASGRVLPFTAQSRPSIGYPWFKRYYSSLSLYDRQSGKLVNDYLDIAGQTWRIPRIFDKWFSRQYQFDSPAVISHLKELRQKDKPLIPDVIDLQRLRDFDRYRAGQVQNNNKHKEV